ncbi:MAG: DUF4262 domain-containing protein [Actinomycetota bacterium]|nr:DUF4262 domain-containing protein [Actinomycetota bacterium]
MCWTCDHPGSTYQDQLDHLRGLMVRHGWAVQGVEGDRVHPPIAYTLGLTLCGLPELVVTGMSLTRSAALLNRVAGHLMHAEPPGAGERIPLVGGPLIEIVELAHPDAHLDTAVAFFGRELRALQLVWADDRGGWPWDRGFRGSRGGQPVLGPRTAWTGSGNHQ